MSLFNLSARLRHRLWSKESILLLVRPAGKPLDESKRKPFAGELRLVTEENIMDCAAFEDAAQYVPVYREMLKRGDVVHYGYLDGKCVYRHAVQLSGEVQFEGRKVRQLDQSKMLTHYSFCVPEARGNGFQFASLWRMMEDYPDRTAYTMVLADNKPPLAINFRIGYEPYSEITVKNRFFHRRLQERELRLEEKQEILASVGQKK